MSSADYRKGLEKVRELLAKAPKAFDGFQEMINARDAVIGHYQPLFSNEALGKLDAEQFRSFLLFENNRHWTGLHGHGGRICADMKKLRAELALLLDEEKPVSTRWNRMIDGVPGMGKAVVSALLLIAHPDKYGVWSNASEAALRALGIWPELSEGVSSGEEYAAVNALLNQLAKDLQVDLWTLDALFGWLKPKNKAWKRTETPKLQLSEDQLAELERRCDAALACETAQEQRDEMGNYLHMNISSLPEPLREKFMGVIDDIAWKTARQ